jgi:hypothetical protein
VIQLIFAAKLPRLKPGRHQLVFRNDHLPSLSVYQVNALVPESKKVEITRQIRDDRQRVYQLEFNRAALP